MSYAIQSLPIVASQKYLDCTGRPTIHSTLRMIDYNYYNGPSYGEDYLDRTVIDIVNNAHDITFGFPVGEVDVYTGPSNTGYGMVRKFSTDALSLAQDADTSTSQYILTGEDRKFIYTYDIGDKMFNDYEAPHRRVGFFIGEAATDSLTADGWRLFDQALCWAIGNCGFPKTIASDVSSSYCPDDPVSLSFTTEGTFNPGNVFTLELSDANGSFASPLTLATMSGTGGGTFNSTIPSSGMGNGTDFRLRVNSSDPDTAVYMPSSAFAIRAPYVDIGDELYTCDGSDTTLYVEPGYDSYLWNTGASTNSITTSGSGTYSVRVSNNWGCEAKDTVDFTIFNSELYTMMLDSSVFCPDDPIRVPFDLCPGAAPCSDYSKDDDFNDEIGRASCRERV